MNNRKNDEKNNFLLEFNEINISQCIFIISMPTQILEWIHGIDSWIHKFMVWVHVAGEEIRMNQWMLDVECWMLNVTCMKMFFMLSWDCHWNPKRNMF